MNEPLLPAFRFATEAQWNSCLFVGADRQTAATRTGLRPFAPYAMPPLVFATHGAHAPTISETSDIIWRDGSGNVAIWEMNGTTVLNASTSFVANVSGTWSIQNPQGN